MVSPNGTPGAETSGLAAEAPEQVQGTPEVETVAGGPAPSGSAEPVGAQSDDAQAVTGEAGGDAEAAADASPDDAADRADLETYPESVREQFKLLKPAQRRALYEHAETNARTQIEAANKRAAEIQAAEAARQAQVQKVLDSQGKFVGSKPIDLTDMNGNIVPGPTYDELVGNLQTRRGRDELYSKYGLDESAAEAVKQELDHRRAMLDGSVELFRDAAWGTLAQNLMGGLESVEGVDAQAIAAAAAAAHQQGGNGPATVISQVVAQRDAYWGRKLDEQKSSYEARLGAHVANAEGLRGLAVAGSSRQPATGGRTGGSNSSRSVRERLIEEAGGIAAFSERAARGEYAHIDLTK